MSHTSAIRQDSNKRRVTVHEDYLGIKLKPVKNVTSSIHISMEMNSASLTAKGAPRFSALFVDVTAPTTLLGGIRFVHANYCHTYKFSFIFQHLN